MLIHFILAVFLSQGVIAGDATADQSKGVFEHVGKVTYSYPDTNR